MRIISKFHDYYDCIQGLGQDQTVVYLRYKQEVAGWPFPICVGEHAPRWNASLVTTRVVGFCGKIIPLIAIQPDTFSAPVLCWSIEDVDSFMKTALPNKGFTAYLKSKCTRSFVYNRRRDYFKRFFDGCSRQEKNYEYLFRDYHSPLFVATSKPRVKGEIVFNDCLRDIEFYTRFDNYQAFQEISMYMGGVLGTHGGHKTKYKGSPMNSNVSDKDLAIAKGFDKHSFRSSK